MQKILFLYLQAFSYTGGIEKFNRSFLKALHELTIDGSFDAKAMSMYDNKTDEKYFSEKRFKGYNRYKLRFVVGSILYALQHNVIIIGHINLAIVGLIIKRIKPSIKLVLIAHGIEIWEQQKGTKKKFIEKVDCFLAVSNYTKKRMLEANSFLDENKIKIFPNTIDSYFKIPTTFQKPSYLIERYNIKPHQKIIITITRLSSTEKYKGYDHVLNVLAQVNNKYNGNIRYFLGGKADEIEKQGIEQIITENNIRENVELLGFIKDEELIDHYLLADVFVMPSKKEGFGIVFIEAMACGLKVIAGNKDGSVDALKNGELGMLVNPDNEAEIENAIVENLNDVEIDSEQLQKKVLDSFEFKHYKERLRNYITETFC